MAGGPCEEWVDEVPVVEFVNMDSFSGVEHMSEGSISDMVTACGRSAFRSNGSNILTTDCTIKTKHLSIDNTTLMNVFCIFPTPPPCT